MNFAQTERRTRHPASLVRGQVVILATAMLMAMAGCASETPTPPSTATPMATATAAVRPTGEPGGGIIGGASPSAIASARGPGPSVAPPGTGTPAPSGSLTPAPTAASLELGLGWSAVATSGLEGAELRGIVATPSGSLAVGGSVGGTGPPAWISPDGLAWTRAVADGSWPAGAQIHAVAAGGPGYVAVGTVPSAMADGRPTTTAAVFISTDGGSWSPANPIKGGNDSELLGVVASPDRLVAVGRVGKVGAAAWTSQDGVTWRRSTKGYRSEPLTVMHGVALAEGGYVAVGQGAMGAAVWTSPDGLRWRRESDGPPMHRGAMRAVVRTATGLVAVGDNIWTSQDGRRWTSIIEPTLQTPELWAVVSTADGLTAVGNDRDRGAVAWQSSDDGKTWSAAPPQDELTGGRLFATAVVAGGSGAGVVAVGETGGSGMVRRSPPEGP